MTPRLVCLSSEKEGLIKGFEAVREHHEEFGFVDGGKEKPNRFWLEDAEIDGFERAAIVKAVWYSKREGSERVQRARANA